MPVDVNRKFRIAVGVDDVRSLTFTVKRHKSDAYLMCRELPGLKLSYHKSGIHRLAENSTDARLPIEHTTLTIPNPGIFCTVTRIFFTTQTEWNSRAPADKFDLLIAPESVDHVIAITLGFTSHHPSARLSTNFGQNKITLTLSELKYLTATLEIFSISEFISQILPVHTPHRNTTTTNDYIPVANSATLFDHILFFRSKLNTYTIWAHHNIPRAEKDTWQKTNPIFLEFAEAYALHSAGINIGPSQQQGVAFMTRTTLP